MENETVRGENAPACEACRKRKRKVPPSRYPCDIQTLTTRHGKCDRIHPICSGCQARDLQCHYIFERPAKRKHDPHYIDELESQIQLLKEEIRRRENLHPASPMADNIADIMTADDTIPKTMPHGSLNMSDMSSSAAINDVSSLMWRLKVADNGETAFIGPSGNFCFDTDEPEIASPVSHSDGGALSSKDERNQIVSDSPRRIEQLVALFAKFINPVHQFVDNDTLSEVREGSSEEFSFLHLAILAAGSLYSDYIEDKSFGSEKASLVEAMALKTCRTNPSLKTVQALTIMCWREIALDNEKMGWMYNAMACSLALHLGLTVLSLERIQDSTVGRDRSSIINFHMLQAKALWSVVLLDRISTSLLGRNCLIPWRRVSAPYYLEVAGENATLQEVVFDYHCRLWFIHDQFMDIIYSFEFSSLDTERRHKMLVEARERLLSFRRDLDPRLRLTKDVTEPTIIFCHMSYHMSQLLIHRPYLNEPPKSHVHRLSIRSMTAEAAEVVKLVRAYDRIGSFDKVPPFIVHSVQTAAITLLLNATSTDQTFKSQSINRFRVCFDVLDAMSSRWRRAQNALTVLRQLAHKWNIIRALPMRYSGQVSVRNPPDLNISSQLESDPQTSQGVMGFPPEDVEFADLAIQWEDIEPIDFFDYSLLDIDLPFPNMEGHPE
ncbi:hypothetical protein N7456_002148 [Penicillium angulare]|uniref:Xylanolytic transcriptional activator regulatory domain-containing protein n=1 Tax=Penicillium angulare TaxID=116970 RepID=A0A9W9G7W8_9EURO|nr:hypothetical protein N7456_002148 [Penicillium angulare]